MIFAAVKDELRELIDISESCPDKYQLKCFEILLTALVQGQPHVVPTSFVAMPAATNLHSDGKLPNVFLQQGVTDGEVNKVFHREGSTVSVIVQDLKAKATAQRQIRLAQLQGLKSLLETGTDPTIAKDALVELCKQYGCYDSSNFAANIEEV